jgi:beta-lactamase regulating signal transducer with metallopeptidase domain
MNALFDALARIAPGDAAIALTANALAQVTVVILLAAALSRTVLRRQAAARHGVWLSALVCTLLSPALAVLAARAGLVLGSIPIARPAAPLIVEAEGPRPRVEDEDKPVPAQVAASAAPMVSASGPAIARDRPALASDRSRRPAPAPVDWRRVLIGGGFLVWAVGALLLMVRFLGGVRRAADLVRSSRPIEADAWREVLDHVRATLAVPELPPVATADGLAGPVAVGVFRPRVIVPEGLTELIRGRALHDVLVHECAHLLRRDPMVGVLQWLAAVLFWPHPFVHYLNRQLARAREEVCDNYVLRHGDARSYASTLLELTERCHPAGRSIGALGLIGPRWSLAERVAGLLDQERVPMTRMHAWAFGALATILTASSLAIAGVRLAGRDEPAKPTTTPDRTAAAPAPSEPDPTQEKVEGVVVDEAGRPVAGAEVRLTDSFNEERARTADDGSFVVTAGTPSLGGWRVLASVEDGARQAFGVIPFERQASVKRVTPLRLTLAPTRTVVVRVKDAQGASVSGATVAVVDNRGATLGIRSESDAQGMATLRFPVDPLPGNELILWILAVKPGVGADYYENYRSWIPSGESKVPESVTLVLNGARPVTIKAVDSAGRAVPDFLFSLSFKLKGKIYRTNPNGSLRDKMRTDTHGIATFDWFPANLDSPASIGGVSREYVSTGDQRIEPGGATELTVRVLRKTRVSGKVTLPDGRPAAGIRIQAEGRGDSRQFHGYAFTAAAGTYAIDAYPEQNYMVAVDDKEWAAPSRTGIVLHEGEPRAGVDFALTKGTLLHGRVTTGPDRTPVSGMLVLGQLGEIHRDRPTGQEQLGRSISTDAEGRYSVRVGPGEYQFWGADVEHDTFKVGSEAEIVHDVHREGPRIPLAGVVVDADAGDRPVAGALVSIQVIFPNGGHSFSDAAADAEGRFRLSERFPHPTVVYARDPEGTRAGFASCGADAREIEVPIGKAATVNGVVLDEVGKPRPGLRVRFLMRSGPVPNTAGVIRGLVLTDADGRFAFSGLAVGTHCEVGVSPRGGFSPDNGPKFERFAVRNPDPIELKFTIAVAPGPDPTPKP